MCRPGVGAANPLFSLWRGLWHPTAPANPTKSRREAEESRIKLSVASHVAPVLNYCLTVQGIIEIMKRDTVTGAHVWFWKQQPVACPSTSNPRWHLGTWTTRYLDISVLTWTSRYSVLDSSGLGWDNSVLTTIVWYLLIVNIFVLVVL